MGNHFPHILGIIWISASPEIFKKPIKLKCFWSSCTMEIHISHILRTAWIFASSRKFKKPLTLKCLCFPIFSPYYGNSLFFLHILGLVWINASHEICIRNIALECLCFPIRSPYYVNSVFPYYRNCMGFYITRNRVVRNM